MMRLLEKRDPWGHGLGLWVLTVMVFLTPLCWWAVQRIELKNDVENWLPSDDPQALVLAWYHEHFASEDRVLVTWKGSSLEDPRVDEFASRLEGRKDAEGNRRGGLPQIDGVITPAEVIDRMTADRRRVESISREEAIERLTGVLIGPGRSPVALSVKFSEQGSADKTETIERIREAALASGIPAADLHMGGRPYAGNELNEAVGRAAWNTEYPLWKFHKRSPFLMSAIVGVILAFVMLRSVRLATLVLVSAFYTMFVAVALVPVTGGNMNMVLVVMPTLLMVLTISAAIHVCNYWKNAAHEELSSAVTRAVQMAWQPCLLAALTTAIGLLSLMTSPLSPVRDFGVYSAVGCLISVLVVLYGLPALLQYWRGRAPDESEVDRSNWRGLGHRLARHRMAVTAACIGAFLIGTAGLYFFRTETKVIRYFPDDARVVQDYQFLEEQLAGIIPVDTILVFDRQAQEDLDFLERAEIVRKVQDQLQTHADISGTLSVADFLPIVKKPSQTNPLQRRTYNETLARIEARVKPASDSKSTRSGNSMLRVAAERAVLHPSPQRQLSIKEGDELWRITAQVAILSETDYGELTRDVNSLTSRTLSGHPGADHLVTGMVPLFLRTQQAVLESLIKSFALAFGIIAIVMMILLRNPLAGVLTMLPNLLPVGLVFGLISWSGLAVDIGTMITASVALGIAVDGTLHLLTWFREGIRSGLDREEAVANSLAHCGPAMWQTSAAVGLGLLMLYPADLLLVSRFGWLMSCLIGAALVADIIFLPALLAGPLGSLIERTNRRSATAPAESQTAPELAGPHNHAGVPALHSSER